MVYVKEKCLDFYGVLYIVKKILERVIHGYFFENVGWILSGLLGLLKSDKRKHLYIFKVIDCPYTIYDMQIGKDYLNHYNEFLHIVHFEKIFW